MVKSFILAAAIALSSSFAQANYPLEWVPTDLQEQVRTNKEVVAALGTNTELRMFGFIRCDACFTIEVINDGKSVLVDTYRDTTTKQYVIEVRKP